MMKILFLGASNTDCRHCFSEDNLGYGYVKYIAEKLMHTFPQQLSLQNITNGGTDGFTFPRIYQKWLQMYANGWYDLVVILGGINEVGVIQNTVLDETASKKLLNDSEAALSSLLSSILNSETKHILLCEPFLFSRPEYLLNWMDDLNRVCQMIRQVCSQYPKESVHYIPTQHIFTQSAASSESAHFESTKTSSCCPTVSTDGIHLSDTGHRLLGELLFQKICAIIGGEKGGLS